jgi:hypothetical protein
MTTQGITAKSLPVQVADPKNHVEVQVLIISITLAIPQRLLMGSEQAKLASTQDDGHWNKRLDKRRKKYITPYIINPMIDRLIIFGVLPEPKEYRVEWPDLSAPGELDKAEVMAKLVEGFAKYVGGGVDQLIPPRIFLSLYAGLDEDKIDEILTEAKQREMEMEEDERERMELEAELQSRNPQPKPIPVPKKPVPKKPVVEE